MGKLIVVSILVDITVPVLTVLEVETFALSTLLHECSSYQAVQSLGVVE